MDQLIASFPKNALEEVHVRLQTWKGRRFVDIRVFYKTKDGSEPRHTKKGICLAVDDLQELAKVETTLKGQKRT